MRGKFIGFEHISGTGKTSGKPYDFVKYYCIAKTRESVVGYSPVEITSDLADVQSATGLTLAELHSILNSDVEFEVGYTKFGTLTNTGFRVIRAAPIK